MAMVVRSNLMALNANRQLSSNNSQVSKSLEKLSSGFKINRAGDDASGLAISEKMKAQIKGLEQASANAQDGISLVQTAEGAMTEVHSMLNRMTELATKSSNGTISDEVDRDAIQNEVNQLVEEIDRIGDSTNFNGINLLDGSLGKSGGTSGAKGAASVSVDALLNAKLKDVAASKATSTIGVVTTVADDTGASWEIAYQDKNGATKTIKVELTKSTDASAGYKYKVDGGEEKTAATKAASATGAITPTLIGDLLKEVLSETEMADSFDIGNAAGVLTFTAKTAGASKAKILVVNEDTDTGAVTGGKALASVNAAGVDQYHQLDIGADFKVYDGTDATKDGIITINGKKFAFVAKGTDTSKFAPDITTVAIADAAGTGATATADVSALITKINDTFGSGTAELNAAGGTVINFKAVEGKATAGGQGLTLQIGDTNDSFNKVTVQVDDVRSAGLGVKGLDVSTQKAAGDAIKTIRTAINTVSTNRGNLGALQNRLEYAINNLDVTAENMTAANSRIRDTDMAKEMMNYTKMNVLTQSAQAMLAQANQQPQSILQLLQ